MTTSKPDSTMQLREFVKVMPIEYRNALLRLAEEEAPEVVAA